MSCSIPQQRDAIEVHGITFVGNTEVLLSATVEFCHSFTMVQRWQLMVHGCLGLAGHRAPYTQVCCALCHAMTPTLLMCHAPCDTCHIHRPICSRCACDRPGCMHIRCRSACTVFAWGPEAAFHCLCRPGTSPGPIIPPSHHSWSATVGEHARPPLQFAGNFRLMPGRDLGPYEVTAARRCSSRCSRTHPLLPVF